MMTSNSFVMTLAAGAALLSLPATDLRAEADPFLGEIAVVGESFCPRGWVPANGQLLPINANQSLYSLLGTTYGGDGRTTFGVPNMNGRMNMHHGHGSGLSDRRQGQMSGSSTVTETIATMANHTHTEQLVITPHGVASTQDHTSGDPAGKYIGVSPAGQNIYTTAGSSLTPMGAASVAITGSFALTNSGGQQAYTNQQPFLAMTTCIATQGLFPSRN